jgi:DNA-binding Lrp family transcriptional regulator
LKLLFENGRENIAKIARKLNTTIEIVRNRIRNFETKGIIIRYLPIIDFHRLNLEFFKTFVYLNHINENSIEELKKYCLRDKNIIHFLTQISPWDVELEIICDNFKHYNEIISNLTKEFPEIIEKIETSIISEDYVFPAEKMIFE